MSGLAALLWIKLPGGSERHLRGRDRLSLLPDQARRWTMNSPFVPADGRRLGAAADVSATTDGHDRT